VTRFPRVIDGAVEAGLVALLVFAPLPHGSIVPWAQVVIEGGVVLLLALSIMRMAISGELEIRRSPLLWPALAMACLVGWQMLFPSGSISRYATGESARLYGAYFGLLLVVSGLPMTRARLVRLLSALVGWAVVLAGVGFARQLGLAGSWLPAYPAAAGRLTSTFVNPNHQALYFSVALFVALGLFLRPPDHGRRSIRRSEAERPAGSLERLPVRVFLVGGILVLGLALVLTLSRGGVASTVAGVLAMLVLALAGRAGNRATLPILVLVLGLASFAGWVGIGAVTDRFALAVREPAADLRVKIWTTTLRVVSEAPIAGIGLGSFQDGFAPYRPVEVPPDKFVDYAHNDFLQLLTETGLLGLLIAVWTLVALLAFLVRGWRGRRDPFVRGLVLGGTGAVVTVAVHSFVDFGLHMPANAVVVTVVIGLLPLAITLHREGAEERVGLERWRWELTPRWSTAVVFVVTLAMVTAGVLLAPSGVAAWQQARVATTLNGVWRRDGTTTQLDLTRARENLRTAIAWDRSNPAAWAGFASVSAELGQLAWTYGLTPSGDRLSDRSVAARLGVAQPLLADAYEAYRTSLRLHRRVADVHERFGWFLGTVESVRQATQKDAIQGPIDSRLAGVLGGDQSVLPEALAHFQEAIHWDPQNPQRYRRAGSFALTSVGRTDDYEAASTAFRQALTLNPGLLNEIVRELLACRVDDQVLLAAMPRRFDTLLDLGSMLERLGRPDGAVAAFEAAIGVSQTPGDEVEARLAYARALIGRKDTAAALEQARRALVLAPAEAEVFALLATIYSQTNQGTEADIALATAVTLVESGSGPAGRRNRVQGELAALFVQRGELERAMTLWRQILRDRPNDAWAHLELGRILERRGQGAEALQEYRTAATVGGEDWVLHRAVARAFRNAGYLREAVASFEVAIRLHPTDGDLGSELGDLYARIGLADLAIQQYRDVLRHQPDHAAALRGLTNVRLSTGS
jgi:tetratricopeptide (TPR) repeat protein/O-antigen ligase